MHIKKEITVCQQMKRGTMKNRFALNNGDFIAIFNSGHRVLQAEKVIKENKIDTILIPAPRKLNTDCAFALRFEASLYQNVIDILKTSDLIPPEVYRYKDDNFIKVEIT